jgi:hypothetical protein
MHQLQPKADRRFVQIARRPPYHERCRVCGHTLTFLSAFEDGAIPRPRWSRRYFCHGCQSLCEFHGRSVESLQPEGYCQVGHALRYQASSETATAQTS